MNFTVPLWEVENYAHDRRAHAHRCKCCRKVLVNGDAVIMAKVKSKKTWAIHKACGDVQHGTAAWTWRDAMKWWAFEHQISVYGLNKFEQRDWPKIEKYRAEAGVVQPSH